MRGNEEGVPNTGDKDGVFGHDEMAGTGTRHDGETVECLLKGIIGEIFIQMDAFINSDFGTHSSDPACVGVDNTAANFGPWGKTKLVCGGLGKFTDDVTRRCPDSVLIL